MSVLFTAPGAILIRNNNPLADITMNVASPLLDTALLGDQTQTSEWQAEMFVLLLLYCQSHYPH